MDAGAAILFTDYSIGPAALGRALEERGFGSLRALTARGLHDRTGDRGQQCDREAERESLAHGVSPPHG